MIVVDASAMVEALVGRDAAASLLDALDDAVCAPHLLDVEVLSVLRGLTLSGKLTTDMADQARGDFFTLAIERYPTDALADRIWGLRHHFTAYDAAYLALGEATGAPVVTCDSKLAAPGHDAQVVVVPPSR